MRILVTGASGGLGQTLRESIGSRPRVQGVTLRADYWVSPRATANGSDAPIDIRAEHSVSAALAQSRPETVVHFAALAGADSERDLAVTQDVNVDAVEHLARSARDHGARRFIFASSSAIYGDRQTVPVSETSSPDPRSAYARSKLDAESRLRSIATDTGLEVVALRIFNVYGPQFPNSLLTRLLASTAEHPVELRGGPRFVRDYVNAADVVEIVRRSMVADFSESFTPLNVGSGRPVSNAELPKLLAPAEVHYRATPGVPSYSCADITQLHNVLNYHPVVLGGLRG